MLAGVLGVLRGAGVVAGVVLGTTAGEGAETGARLASRYSGPFWPQAASRVIRAAKAATEVQRNKLKGEFTIRITVTSTHWSVA